MCEPNDVDEDIFGVNGYYADVGGGVIVFQCFQSVNWVSRHVPIIPFVVQAGLPLGRYLMSDKHTVWLDECAIDKNSYLRNFECRDMG